MEASSDDASEDSSLTEETELSSAAEEVSSSLQEAKLKTIAVDRINSKIFFIALSSFHALIIADNYEMTV